LAVNRFPTEVLPAGTRIACRIEYDGRRFNGWQLQTHPGVLSVQEALERGLTSIAATPVRVQCAGRTDTGVHAHAQIVHFDAPVARSCKAWVLGTNASLPHDVCVHWAIPVSREFHARFSAQSRCYRYIIANTPVRPALLHGQVTWHRRRLDTSAMHCAAQALLGERDFSAFRASSCQSSTPMREVLGISVSRRSDMVVIEVRANAFLHHMVRNIAGALLAVGDGRESKAWIAALLAGRDRRAAAETAPADGLYLVDVAYAADFGLPPTPFGPLWLAPGNSSAES